MNLPFSPSPRHRPLAASRSAARKSRGHPRRLRPLPDADGGASARSPTCSAIPSATPTSAKPTFTPVGRWTPGSWATGSPGPDDAYKYAQGQPIKHPMGYDIKIETPLDFMGVTDHSEYVGVTKAGQHSRILREQAARGEAPDHERPEQQGRAKPGLLVSAQAQLRRAGEGVHGPEDHGDGVGGKRQDRRREQSSRQVHGLPLVRVDLDARQSQPAPQCFLPGCDKVPDCAVQLARLQADPTELWKWMDTQRKAGNELLAISHNANVSDGWMYPIDIDNTTGRPIDAAWAELAHAQRAADRDQAGQGTIGNASVVVAERRVRRLRDVSRPSSASRPTWAGSITSRAALPARR